MVKIFPGSVLGEMWPYPMVVMIVIVKRSTLNLKVYKSSVKPEKNTLL